MKQHLHSLDFACCMRNVINREAGTRGLKEVLSLRYDTNFPSRYNEGGLGQLLLNGLKTPLNPPYGQFGLNMLVGEPSNPYCPHGLTME